MDATMPSALSKEDFDALTDYVYERTKQDFGNGSVEPNKSAFNPTIYMFAPKNATELFGLDTKREHMGFPYGKITVPHINRIGPHETAKIVGKGIANRGFPLETVFMASEGWGTHVDDLNEEEKQMVKDGRGKEVIRNRGEEPKEALVLAGYCVRGHTIIRMQDIKRSAAGECMLGEVKNLEAAEPFMLILFDSYFNAMGFDSDLF